MSFSLAGKLPDLRHVRAFGAPCIRVVTPSQKEGRFDAMHSRWRAFSLTTTIGSCGALAGASIAASSIDRAGPQRATARVEAPSGLAVEKNDRKGTKSADRKGYSGAL